MRRQIKAALFDLYDTLTFADTRRLEDKIHLCANICNVRPDDYAFAWKELVVDSNLGKLKSTEDRVLALLKRLGKPEDSKVARDVARIEHDFLRSGIYLHNDSISTLNSLRQLGLKLGIITNASFSVVEVLNKYELEKYVDCVVISSMVGYRKPDPRIYNTALNDLGVDAVHCIFIGDGNDGELDGAHELGMLTVCADLGTPKYVQMENSLPSSVNHTIRTLAEVISLIKSYECSIAE
jgi:putative hydrolase of the HAD superfamily